MQASAIRSAGNGVDVHMTAFAHYGGGTTNITRTWALRTDLDSNKFAPTVTGNGTYVWTVNVKAQSDSTQPFQATFCVTEMETGVIDTPPPTLYDPSTTTKSVNAWLAELSPFGGDAVLSRGLVNSWFRFWFNTEHDGNAVRAHVTYHRITLRNTITAGNWVAPIITPSMSR